MSDLTAPAGPPPVVGWLAAIGAALLLLLALTNVALQLTVSAQQRAVNRLRVFNAQTPGVARIDNTLIRALAVQAASKQDTRIKAMLIEAGIRYHLTPPPKPAP